MSNLSREQVIVCYMMNDKKVIAEMLYDTITRYESEIEQLKSILKVYKPLEKDNPTNVTIPNPTKRMYPYLGDYDE